MNRKPIKLLGALIVLGLLAGGWWVYVAIPWAGVPDGAIPAGRAVEILPDYVDCVIPPNIAPLNFLVRQQSNQYRTHIHGPSGEGFVVASRKPTIAISQDKWRQLLAANTGGEIWFDDVLIRKDGKFVLDELKGLDKLM